MMETTLSLLLASVLVAAPAPADKEFDELKATFAAKITDSSGAPEFRAQYVRKVAKYDNRDAARLLVGGLAVLDEKYAKDLKAFEKLQVAYEEVNSPLDVMGDDYATRTNLENQIREAEVGLRNEKALFGAFVEAIAGLKDAKAISTIGSGLKKEKSYRLKEVAAEGLAKNTSEKAWKSAVKWLRDDDGRVRSAFYRGLLGRKEREVYDIAVKGLKDTDWVVRRHAASVLDNIAEPRVLKPLIEALGGEEGRLRDDIRDILRRLTSQNFDADSEAWQHWYNKNKDEILGDGPDDALFGAFKKIKAPKVESVKKGVYGIETRSRRILFIIDTSHSMSKPLAGKEPAKGTATGLDADEEDELNSTKLEIAKRELKRAIRSLEMGAMFNIVSYNSDVIRWKKQMVVKDMPIMNEALLFVRDMQAAGGTYTYGALQEGFKMGGMGVTDKRYDPVIDTIYLISDGAPTDNSKLKPTFMKAEIILKAVRGWNPNQAVIVHAVAVDTKAAGSHFIDFMKKLAKENGGQYTQRN
ncbi:MAG: HEAT repeat domain-containing protein [Planctomycetota bacterium]|jgi:uncharacterized protein YegL